MLILLKSPKNTNYRKCGAPSPRAASAEYVRGGVDVEPRVAGVWITGRCFETGVRVEFIRDATFAGRERTTVKGRIWWEKK